MAKKINRSFNQFGGPLKGKRKSSFLPTIDPSKRKKRFLKRNKRMNSLDYLQNL